MFMKRWLISLFPALVLFLSGCAGYQINGTKPLHMENVTKLYVPTFENATLEPRLSVLVTNAVIKQIQATGAYQVVDESEAEATLKGKIDSVDRSQWRAVRTDTLRTNELLMRMRILYKVVDTSGATLRTGRTQITSYAPLDPNWQTSERQILSEVAERLSVSVSDDLANGW